MTFLLNLITAAVLYGTPLLYGTSGEILTEKSGNLNLGVEGMMFMGGALGLGAAFYYEKLAGAAVSAPLAVVIAIAASFLAGALAALLFSFLTITLRANQNVTGLALTIFGTGVGQYIGEFMRVREGTYVAVSNTLKGAFNGSPFPVFLQELPVVGRLLFSHSIFTYLGIAMAVAMGLYLHRSRSGLYLRAVGESPATADAAGISVTRYKYLATVIGGGISAIGGMVYIMTVVGGVWNHEGLSGVGWLAVALVISLPVEPLPGHLGFHPLRRPAHSLPAHAHRPDPRPDLQDPALCGHRDRAGLYLHAQQPRQAAAGQFGPGVFPGGAVSHGCLPAFPAAWRGGTRRRRDAPEARRPGEFSSPGRR